MDIGQLYASGFCYAPGKWHFNRQIRANRLYHIHGGNGSCYYHGKKSRFQPGKLYFIPYYEDLELECDESEPILHTYADFELIPPIVTREVLVAAPEGREDVAAALQIFCIGGKRQTEMSQNGGASLMTDDRFYRLYLESILYLIHFLMEVNQAPVIRDEVVVDALMRIHSNLHEPLSVETLSAAAYMNSDSFIRRFQKAVGMTPYAYRKQLRLRTASYLRTQGLSLSEIAAKVGYSDASALLHAMRRDS